MSSTNSSFYQGLLDSKTKLHFRQSLDPIQQEQNFAVFAVTLTGAELAADFLILGPLLIPGARIIPENIRVRHSAGGAGVSIPATLQKVDKDFANAVVLTSTVTLISTAVQVFASANALQLPELEETDILQLLLSGTVTTLAGRTLYIEVPYRLTGR